VIFFGRCSTGLRRRLRSLDDPSVPAFGLDTGPRVLSLDYDQASGSRTPRVGPMTSHTSKDERGRERRTARAAGAWYLGLAITGIAGFLLIRPAVYDPDDAATTLKNLTTDEGLARLGLGVELAIVVTQALAAVWFYKLFRPLNAVAAWSVGVFGMVNAVAILASSAAVATALEVSRGSGLAPGGDAAATTQLLFRLSESFWGVGNLFFGLWLIPMGWVAATSGRFPRALGWILIAGGVGYIASAFVEYAFDAPTWLGDALTTPATIGEFWMIGYLLVIGVRPAAERPSRAHAEAAA